jgi:hypothetical protein
MELSDNSLNAHPGRMELSDNSLNARVIIH